MPPTGITPNAFGGRYIESQNDAQKPGQCRSMGLHATVKIRTLDINAGKRLFLLESLSMLSPTITLDLLQLLCSSKVLRILHSTDQLTSSLASLTCGPASAAPQSGLWDLQEARLPNICGVAKDKEVPQPHILELQKLVHMLNTPKMMYIARSQGEFAP